MQNNTDIKSWLGKSELKQAVLEAKHANLLGITLGKDELREGHRLPGLWHWAWFNEAKPLTELGRDGHPKRGGFLPPVPLPRRMWAGGELEFHEPLIVGKKIDRKSIIENIQNKQGHSGDLCIVTILHELRDGQELCVSERQNLVFREDPKPDAPTPPAQKPPMGPEISRDITPDPVTMFRYSALTFNGHRIHYDADYARDVEGYPELVFHAPLTATHLFDLAQELIGKAPIAKFSYRATAPIFAGRPFSIHAKREEGKISAWAITHGGNLAMSAEMTAQNTMSA